MRKLIKTAIVASGFVVVIAGAANARVPVRTYHDHRNIERQVSPREFRSVVDTAQRPAPSPSVPEHAGPAYDLVGAP